MLVKIILLLFASIIAFWISAICGGGASLILIPVLNGVLVSSLVPFSLTVGTFTSSVSRIAVFRKYINWKVVVWFVPFSIPAVILGAFLIKQVNPFYLQLLVALFLISNLPFVFKTKSKLKSEEKPYPKAVLALVGFFAGFISGITGAIGLLFNRFYLRYGLSKEGIVATRAANEIILHSIKLIVYVSLGLYSNLAFYIGLSIALASVISTFSLKWILPLISDFLFRKIGYLAMVLSGFVLLFNTGSRIIEQDGISINTLSTNENQESTIQWRESSFVLEYGIDEVLEVETSISFEELPKVLQEIYLQSKSQYDKILLEKVWKLGESNSYEFYCFKDGTVSKKEFEEPLASDLSN